MRSFIKILIISLLVLACEKEDSSGSSDSGTNPEPQRPSQKGIEIKVSLSKETNGDLYNIIVNFNIKKNNENQNNLSPKISLSRGTLSPLQKLGNGNYSFKILPDQTGEHKFTISHEDKTISKTPLVLKEVHSDWGVPMSVEGYVNTSGYEDGVTVTPDGEYLFVQTGPQYSSGSFLMEVDRTHGGCGGATNRLNPTRCSHKLIDELAGPYTAPERPGFFNGRFSGNTVLHNANSWGVGMDQAPNYAISTMFYGFKRQKDGSFKEPFHVAFNDENDGIASPFGLSFYMHGDGTATTLFTWNDPQDPDMVDFDGDGNPDAESYFDVFHTKIILGQNNNLGDLEYSGTPGTPPVRGSNFNSSLVNFGKVGINGIAGTQGNSHLHMPNGTLKSIWTDDEYDKVGDYGELSVYYLESGNLSLGQWTKLLLPTKINIPGTTHEIQPFFTGTGLYFTRSGTSNPDVFYSSYSGNHTKTDLVDNSKWSTPEKILGHTSDTSKNGAIIGVGEPTIANYNGKEILYFVYVVLRSKDVDPPVGTGVADLDFQAGYIEKVK